MVLVRLSPWSSPWFSPRDQAGLFLALRTTSIRQSSTGETCRSSSAHKSSLQNGGVCRVEKLEFCACGALSGAGFAPSQLPYPNPQYESVCAHIAARAESGRRGGTLRGQGARQSIPLSRACMRVPSSLSLVQLCGPHWPGWVSQSVNTPLLARSIALMRPHSTA